jgi:hypothetical protein
VQQPYEKGSVMLNKLLSLTVLMAVTAYVAVPALSQIVPAREADDQPGQVISAMHIFSLKGDNGVGLTLSDGRTVTKKNTRLTLSNPQERSILLPHYGAFDHYNCSACKQLLATITKLKECYVYSEPLWKQTYVVPESNQPKAKPARGLIGAGFLPVVEFQILMVWDNESIRLFDCNSGKLVGPSWFLEIADVDHLRFLRLEDSFELLAQIDSETPTKTWNLKLFKPEFAPRIQAIPVAN